MAPTAERPGCRRTRSRPRATPSRRCAGCSGASTSRRSRSRAARSRSPTGRARIAIAACARRRWRAMKCACGHVAYPRISPAMMVLVKRGPAILLARNVAVPAGGRMSALAGFLEPGESIEDAIHREVREEVGLEVKDTRYFASQSWPYPHSLMIAFTAEYAGGELRLDPAEIAEARWFGPGDKLPELSPGQSISRR